MYALEASGGEEALDILSKKKVDMVISDIQMGAMDGHTLLKRNPRKTPKYACPVNDSICQYQWCCKSNA